MKGIFVKMKSTNWVTVAFLGLILSGMTAGPLAAQEEMGEVEVGEVEVGEVEEMKVEDVEEAGGVEVGEVEEVKVEEVAEVKVEGAEEVKVEGPEEVKVEGPEAVKVEGTEAVKVEGTEAADDAMMSFGIVTSISGNQIKLLEYDFETETEIEMAYEADENTVYENIVSLNELRPDEEVMIVYEISGDKRIIKSIELDTGDFDEDLSEE